MMMMMIMIIIIIITGIIIIIIMIIIFITIIINDGGEDNFIVLQRTHKDYKKQICRRYNYNFNLVNDHVIWCIFLLNWTQCLVLVFYYCYG